ncbi:MAG: right-handed parallel beta-helix repeat-containing protein [bacterium]|nr:right-handed parallel beta-helix repeat-containing protein [bacterium]
MTPTADEVRLAWRSAAGAGNVGVFVGENEEGLFDGPPRDVVPAADEAASVAGFATGTDAFAGLALEVGGGFEPIGAVLRFRAADAVYVDPHAPAAGADGLTPETAFPDLLSGALTAFATGRNLWLLTGTHTSVSVGLLDGVHVYGGFAPGFAVAERDPGATPTVLEGRDGDSVLVLAAGRFVIDGVTIDGRGVASNGVEVDEADAELRGVVAGNCTRGIKLRSDETSLFYVSVIDSSLSANGLQGLSLDGAFDIVVDGSTFEANGAEGLDADDWIAPAGERVAFRATDCVFADNGEDGLSIDMGVLAPPGSTGGRFSARVEDCEFLENREAGLSIDLDFELTPAWQAAIEVRGCSSSRNTLSGVHLDLDARASALLHRLTASANGSHGLLVTSESQPGMVTVSASALTGNQGAGCRAEAGNYAVVTSHCVLAGNRLGGLATDGVPALAVSSAAFLQPDPWTSAYAHHSVEIEHPVPAPFLDAPESFAHVVDAGAVSLELNTPPVFGVGATVEVGDDGTSRSVTGVAGTQLTVTPHPSGLRTPVSLAAFAPASAVVEDYRPTLGSVLIDAGMPLASGAPTDAGPFGSPIAGDPGSEDLVAPELFYVASTSPAWALTIGPNEDLIVTLRGGDVDPASLDSGLRLLRESDGVHVPFSASVDGDALSVAPPAGGWTGVHRLELHTALRSRSGTALSVPVALRLREM